MGHARGEGRDQGRKGGIPFIECLQRRMKIICNRHASSRTQEHCPRRCEHAKTRHAQAPRSSWPQESLHVLRSIVRRLVEDVVSKLLRRWGQSVRWRATPVPLGTLELRGCCLGRSLRQSGHRSSSAGKAPIVLSPPDLANTGHRKPVRNHYTHTRRNIRCRRIRSQGTTNKGNRTQRNQNR
jgi:hypothetical protein